MKEQVGHSGVSYIPYSGSLTAVAEPGMTRKRILNRMENSMQIETKYDLRKWGDYNIIWINSDILQDCMDYYEGNHLDGIGISPYIGYKLSELNFLDDYQSLRGLVICRSEKFDLKILKKLKSLRFISLDDFNGAFDFSEFRELEEIKIDYNTKLTFPSVSLKMKRLCIWKYKSVSCEELPDFPNLEVLELTQSSITSLNGIDKYPKLRKLVVSYCLKLTDISAVAGLSPELLEFDTCKKITNHSVVEDIKSLQTLRFNNCGSMPSIKFIDKMKNLHTFCFVNTNVEDGDMSPCLRLNFAGFFNKRHYSHTSEEIEKIVATREQ